MHAHLTEDELVLHFYGETPREDEASVDAHLESCPTCQAIWLETRETLKMLDAAGVPEPDPAFEQRMWARVQAALPASRPRVVVFGTPMRRWLAPAAGLAAALALVVLSRGAWRPAPPLPAVPVAHAAVSAAGRERVLLTALGDHFQQSEMLLVEVMNAPSSADGLGFERRAADDLLDSNRLYRVTAQQHGDVRLAQMLEDLESVLVQIARSPEGASRDDVRSLRTRIDNDDLLFKVRAVGQQVQDRQRSLMTE